VKNISTAAILCLILATGALVMIIWESLIYQTFISVKGYQPVQATVTESVTYIGGTYLSSFRNRLALKQHTRAKSPIEVYETTIYFSYSDGIGPHKGEISFMENDINDHSGWGSPDRWNEFFSHGKTFVVYTDTKDPHDWTRHYYQTNDMQSRVMIGIYIAIAALGCSVLGFLATSKRRTVGGAIASVES
jgi:hypothetical protein